MRGGQSARTWSKRSRSRESDDRAVLVAQHGDVLVIDVPWLHPSANDWRRWQFMRRVREVAAWRLLVQPACRHLVPFEVPVVVRVEYTFGDRVRRDADNHTPKFLLDALVGYALQDDDFWHVPTLTITRCEDGRPRGTRIIIAPASGAGLVGT